MMFKQRGWAVVAVLCAMGVGSTARAEISTFDTDEDGWTFTGDTTTFEQRPTGGNPDGYLHIVDAATGPIIFLQAPSKFEGNKLAYDGGTLSFDFRIISRESGRSTIPEFAEVTLTGDGDSVTLDLGEVPPDDAWTHFSTPMTAAAWGTTPATWTNILGDLTSIELHAEAIVGDETLGMDNFLITPEPGSILLLGLSSLGLAVRRRRE